MFQSRFNKRKAVHKELAAPLILTSLVDAFSIMVIFLIVVASNSNGYEANDTVVLPSVATAGQITDSAKIAVTEKGYIFQNKTLQISQLEAEINKFRDLFSSHKAVIEADKKIAYEKIEPLLRLMADLKIETIQLAVEAEASL